jgi:glutamine cyclotransferase
MYPTDLLTVPNLKDAKAKVTGWFSHDNAPAGSYKILDKFMIAEQRFVEGLEFIDDKTLIMSSGSYGNSHLDILDLETSPIKTIRTTSIDA